MTRLASVLFASALLVACGGSVASVDNTALGPSPSPTVTGGPTPGPAPAPTATTTPPTTSPGTWNAQASGCANVFVFDGHSTGKRFLVISGDRTTMGLQALGDSYTADLATADVIHVFAHTFASAPVEPPYCTDIAYPGNTPEKARAVQGKVTITITSVGKDTDSYAIDVVLQGVVVKGASGLESIPDMKFQSIGVGWLPG